MTTSYDSILKALVDRVVRKQVECGIDVVTDGEYSKPGFFTYIRERFDGFEFGPVRSSSCSSRRFPLSPNIMPSTSRRR